MSSVRFKTNSQKEIQVVALNKIETQWLSAPTIFSPRECVCVGGGRGIVSGVYPGD